MRCFYKLTRTDSEITVVEKLVNKSGEVIITTSVLQ